MSGVGSGEAILQETFVQGIEYAIPREEPNSQEEGGKGKGRRIRRERREAPGAGGMKGEKGPPEKEAKREMTACPLMQGTSTTHHQQL